MGRLLLIINKILGSKHLVVNIVLALVDSSHLITSRALADSKHLTVNPALVSLVASRIHRVLLSNSSLVVRASLSSLPHRGLILVRCKTSSPGKRKLLTSSGKEVTCLPGRVRNKIKVNHSLVKIKRLFPIIGSLVNSKASETFPVCLP